VSAGVAGSLVAMAGILIATDQGEDDRDRIQAIIRFASAGLALLIGLVSASWSANVILLVITSLLAAQIAIDLRLVGELRER